MALILNIDTATEEASVCLTLNGVTLAYLHNGHKKEHASFVHKATSEVLKIAGYSLGNLEAFAVTEGPGSYTGLRVGMATAKGFCYALNKPLIAINTLEVMAKAAINTVFNLADKAFFCPMIDARRMEVFTAIYDKNLNIILPPQPLILEDKTFDNYMTNSKIIFFGGGSGKLSNINTNPNAVFANVEFNAQHLGSLADKAFYNKNFIDISYSEPNYLKDFHTNKKT